MRRAEVERRSSPLAAYASGSRRAIGRSAIECIGQTPLIELSRLHPGPGRILAKLELLQPGGSVKDRAALTMIQRARETGRLQPGQPVVEMTSGNTGAGLAVVCNTLGHPFIAVMSCGNSPERVRMILGLGVELIRVPQVDGRPGQVTGSDLDAARQEALKIAATRDAYFVDQFNNPGNVLAHECGTGPEIWEAVDGEFDAFVAMVGTGGTFVGVSRYLKARSNSVLCAAVEPVGSAIIATGKITEARHIIQGAGYGIVPPLWEPDLADALVTVSDQEARSYKAKLGSAEGIYAGYSSGANVCAAVKLLDNGRLGPDATVVTLLPDTGLKY